MVRIMTLKDYLDNPTEAVGPSYNIYRYTDQIYKVVHFKSTKPRVGGVVKKKSSDDKDKPTDLHSSISRAKRTILELALCNEWDYFCTFTLDPKYDRYDLRKWYGSFAQFIRDQRKKYGSELRFLLVPETHKDGAWHIHGLIKGAPPLVAFCDRLRRGENVPRHLATNNYESWPDYERRFGFNSFGRIKNRVACAFYITKYVSKAIDQKMMDSGAHRYYACVGLNRATLHGDVYGACAYLDKFLVNHYDFCDTGMTNVNHGLDWSFALEYMPEDGSIETFDINEPAPDDRIMFETFFDFIQTKLEGFA